MKPGTKCIHAGTEPDPSTGAIMTPIYQTSTFVQEAPGKNKGFEYARSQNPTRFALEEALAVIENGKYGLAFSSGVAATDAVIKLLQPGDEVIAANDMYGGTYRLFTKIFEKFGIRFHYVNMQQAENIKPYINKNTKLIWTETPTNPLINIVDIAAVAAIAKANNILLCVDNTFASPYLQNPLNLGADIVMHSATKYLGGHSDLIAGLVITKDKELGDKIKFYQNACGAILAPFDSWLVIRGIETLHLRIQQHCRSAQEIAEFLQQHPAVDKVYYPGLKDHPNHNIAKKQSKGFGGIVSFTLKQDHVEAATAFVTGTNLFKLAESLGGIKSLVSHPASMTHKTIPAEKRRAAGVTDSLIRLSIGLEDASDLLKDLQQALEKTSNIVVITDNKVVPC